MTGNGEFKWYWEVGASQPESWQGPCDTREEAINEARDNDGDEYGFSIVEADMTVPRTDVFDASTVLDNYYAMNQHCLYDDNLPNFDLNASSSQLLDLETMLADTFATWFERHNLPRRGQNFANMRNEEFFPAVEVSHDI